MKMNKYASAIAVFIIAFSFLYPASLTATTLQILLPPKGDGPQPVITVTKGVVSVSVTGTLDLTRFRAWLNGREVTPVFDTVQGRRTWHRKARLGASDGLVYDTNQLEVRVASETGESIKVGRTLEVVGDRPLVGAGADQTVRLGHSVRLQGSDSASTAPLRYRWKLFRPPKSSQAQLLDSDTATPLLVPDIAGNYEVGLQVSDGNRWSGWDTVILHATDQPVAINLNSMATDEKGQPGIQVGDTFYRSAADDDKLGIQALVLDRRTLQEQDNISINTLEDLEKLKTTIDHLTAYASLVILARPKGFQGMTPSEADTFNGIVEQLGLHDFAAADLADNTMAISVLGVPGFSAGQGYRAQRSHSNTGIAGKLMVGSKGRFYAFTWADYPTFTINIENPGEIVVGSTPFGRDAQGNSSGVHMLMLDAEDLSGIDNFTFLTSGPNSESEQQKMCANLQDAMRFGWLVFIETFGEPFRIDTSSKAAIDALNCIVENIQWLGGTAHVVAQLNSGARYVLAARGVRPNQAAFEASELITLPAIGSNQKTMKGQLTGVLGRNRQGWFEPLAADDTAKIGYELFDIAFQEPPTPAWPNSSTPGEQAALCSITQQFLNCDESSKNLKDIRSRYTDTKDFHPKEAQLMRANNNPPICSVSDICDASSITDDDFNTVKNQLLTEFADLGHINTFFKYVVKAPFTGTELDQIIEIDTIADDIANDVIPPPNSDLAVEILGVVGDVLSFMTTLIPLIPAENDRPAQDDDDPGAAEGAGLISSILSVVRDIVQLADTGAPGDRVTVTRDQLKSAVTHMTNNNVAAFDRIHEVVVSDWEKLQTVADKGSGNGEWVFSNEVLGNVATAYNRGARLHFWSVLMAAKYKRVVVLPGKQQYGQSCVMNSFFCTPNGFPNNNSGTVIDTEIVKCPTAGLFPTHPLKDAVKEDLGQQWLFSGFTAEDTGGNRREYLNVWADPPARFVKPSYRWRHILAVPDSTLLNKLHAPLEPPPKKKNLKPGPAPYFPWFWNKFERFQLHSKIDCCTTLPKPPDESLATNCF